MRKLGLAAPLFLAACAATIAWLKVAPAVPTLFAVLPGRDRFASPDTLAELQRASGARPFASFSRG